PDRPWPLPLQGGPRGRGRQAVAHGRGRDRRPDARPRQPAVPEPAGDAHGGRHLPEARPVPIPDSGEGPDARRPRALPHGGSRGGRGRVVTLPAGYRAVGVNTPGAHAFAWGDVGAVVEGLLARHGTLRGWSAACDDAVQLTGRGRVAAVPAPAPGPDARPRWVVRPYLRGGAVARFLGDR